MFVLDHVNEELGYKIYQSPIISENRDLYFNLSKLTWSRFNFVFPNRDSTFSYRYYNFFQLTVGIVEFHNMFKSLVTVIKDYIKKDEPLWLQCWINCHTFNSVLARHNHIDSICTGYISIDPKNTETVFDSYTIKNKVGQLYLGPSEIYHYVKVIEPYSGDRITIAFDVLDLKCYYKVLQKNNEIDVNTGYIPI